MYEHSETSVGFPVVDLSSEEEDATPNTSWDGDIAHKLFSNLNCGLLGPLGDGNVIVIIDSEEEQEVHKDDRATPVFLLWIPWLYPPLLPTMMMHLMG
jgi:hypothetical protein